MALAEAPARQRGPVLVSVRRDEWDEARMELMARYTDANEFIADARSLLDSIATTVAHTDPYALQRVVGLRLRLARYAETWR
jgi:hypothetical protein